MEGGTLDVLLVARDNAIHYTQVLIDTIRRGKDAERFLTRDLLRAAEAASWLAAVCRFSAEAKRDLDGFRIALKEATK